jgi:hypothetical protein
MFAANPLLAAVTEKRRSARRQRRFQPSSTSRRWIKFIASFKLSSVE